MLNLDEKRQTQPTLQGVLNLEFFCNTQGHLEFRPPLWNRVPLTVLKAAIKAQDETNKTINK